MRVLISGCGYVGCALGLLLAAEGHTVFGLRREPSHLPLAIFPVAADLSHPLPPRALPPNLDAAVHAVSPSTAGGATEDDAYRTAYVDAPRNLLAALGAQPSVRRLLFVSSTGVYGQAGGEWVDETSPTEPRSLSGRRLLQGEELVLRGPVPEPVVLRLGGIYGPGRAGALGRLLNAPPREDRPPRYTNPIHRDDCAGALRHLLALPNPRPLYLGVDNDPADRRTIADWLAARLAKVPPTAGTLAPQKAPRVRANKRCSNRRLLASGYALRYPTFREGFATLLDEATPNA